MLAARGASGLDVYGWLGSLATYGFIVAYALVCIALPRYLRDHGVFRPGAQIVPWLAGAAMLLALVGNLYPVPEGPYGKLPYVYLAYLTAGLLWFVIRRRKNGLAKTDPRSSSRSPIKISESTAKKFSLNRNAFLPHPTRVNSVDHFYVQTRATSLAANIVSTTQRVNRLRRKR